MTENFVINGLDFELELELKPIQTPIKKKRSLDDISCNNDYELYNSSENIVIPVCRSN